MRISALLPSSVNVAHVTHVTPAQSWVSPVAAALFMVVAIAVGAQGAGPRGGGASLPAAVYAGWAAAYQKDTGKTIQYAATGSGAGLKALGEKTIHFAGSEIALTPAELDRQKLVQLPIAVSGIVPVVNIPGVRSNEITLDGKSLANIYLGKISRWDHPDIRALNPGVTLPRTEIHPVAREESSGTTLVFTQYLSNSSSDWKTTLGEKAALKWMENTKVARGNDGVSEMVKKTGGAIGYVSSNEVVRRNLVAVRLLNPTGDAIVVSPASIRSAIVQAPMNADVNDISPVVNMRGTTAWPIVAVTYALFERAPAATAEVREALKFFYWVLQNGDRLAADTGFVALPSSVQARVVGRFRHVTDAAGKPINIYAN